MRRFSIVLTTIVFGLTSPLPRKPPRTIRLLPPSTAWKTGYPAKCLKNAQDLMASFKAKARDLGRDGKLRVLIIGDSLSAGEYHWSHYFRRGLQAAYGDGGPGAIWSAFAGGAVTRAIPRTKLLFMINWAPRDGQSPPDTQTVKDRIAWYEANHYPYVNLQEGLDSGAMKLSQCQVLGK